MIAGGRGFPCDSRQASSTVTERGSCSSTSRVLWVQKIFGVDDVQQLARGTFPWSKSAKTYAMAIIFGRACLHFAATPENPKVCLLGTGIDLVSCYLHHPDVKRRLKPAFAQARNHVLEPFESIGRANIIHGNKLLAAQYTSPQAQW